jgi:hypothetical protein
MAPGVPKRAWTDDARHRGRRAINAIAEAPVSPAERVLHGQLQARYVIGYQADFRARTEILAYASSDGRSPQRPPASARP